jgi:hypothetical protein
LRLTLALTLPWSLALGKSGSGPSAFSRAWWCLLFLLFLLLLLLILLLLALLIVRFRGGQHDRFLGQLDSDHGSSLFITKL